VKKRALALALSLSVGSLPAQEPEAQPPEPALERADHLARQGRHDAAIEVLRRAVATDGTAEAERRFLARILAWLGRSAEALQVLHQGLGRGDEDDDATLSLAIGRLHEQLADDGPFLERNGEYVAYLPRDPDVDEDAWRRDHRQRALAAYLVVRSRYPDRESAHERVGTLQTQLGQHEAALATWTATAERFPASAAAHLGRARALTALGRSAEAAAACEQALHISPRLADAHAMLGDHHASLDEDAKAQQAFERADFYAWLPAFVELDFDACRASFALLEPRFETEPSRAEHLRAREARRAEIERLLTTPSAESSGLLATLCHRHEDHGDVEDRIFDELRARGEASIPLLRQLLDNAQSSCTRRGAVHALTALRAPGLLPLLVDLLPRDTHPIFSADIAGALASLGDRRAVGALIEVAKPSPGDGTEGAEPDVMTGYGRTLARMRAALAVGALGGDDARSALTVGLEDPVIGGACAVGLYRLTREPELLVRIRSAVLAAQTIGQRMLVDGLESFAPEEAKPLRDEIGERK
jgi:tetratricopeptide (TPR) repeat protein